MKTENTARRTILKGAVWSVPVVSVAAAAPASAASVPPFTVAFSDVSARYIRREVDVYDIRSSATVQLVSGEWPTGGVLLQSRLYKPGVVAGGGGQVVTPQGQQPIMFTSTAGAEPGFEQFALLIFPADDLNQLIAVSDQVDIVQP